MAIVYFMKEATVNHMVEGDFCEGAYHGFVPNPSESILSTNAAS